ncbi:MAG: hypothetical protein U0559_02695 [Anaerolineae bacterium]
MARTRLIVLTLLVLIASFILSSASAWAVPPNVPSATTPAIPIGQIGGVTTAMAWNNGNLFFNVGPRIARLAVSAATPLTPTLPAAYGGILPGIPEDMKIANGYVYVALGRAGVAVVDATTLEVVNTLPLTVTASATAIAVGTTNGHLYLATGSNGVIEYAIDFDHTTLTYLQTKTFTSPIRRISDVETRFLPSTGDEYLFVAANNFSAVPANRGGVLKFDITTEPMLANPVAVKEQIDVNALTLTDAYVYAAGEQAFSILDTTALGTTGSLGTLALTNRAVEVALRPNAQSAYLLDAYGGIDVVDVTNPLSPTKKTANTFYTNGVVMDLTAAEFNGDSNTYLYLADFNAGLSIARAPQSTPENLNLDRPGYLTPKPAIASVVGSMYPQAFAYSIPSKLWTIDSTSLSNLNAVGAGIEPPTTINALVPYSNSLLVADQFGLTRYQLNAGGEPSDPEIFPIPGSGSANAVAVAWPNAIVANGAAGLAVINLSGPLDVVGTAPAPLFNSDFRSVDVQGNFAYVGDYNGTLSNAGQLRIYDLTDPTSPVASGSISQTGILDVKVSGNLAFLAAGTRGIRVVDVSNPAVPVMISTDDYTGTLSARSLAIYKNYLFVADGSAGAKMLAFDPASGQLRLVAPIPTSGTAQKLTWQSGRLYVAADSAGLMVIEIGNDLAIGKTAPLTGYAGQPFTYTLAITNVGVLTASNVIITDVLPANLSLVSATGCTSTTGVVTCTLPSLSTGSSSVFNLVVQPSAVGTYTNTALVASDQLDVEPRNNSSTASTTILALTDLALSKTAAPDPARVGGLITYTLIVTNAGPSAATGVILTDTLPAGVTLATTDGGCAGSTTLVCSIGTLNAGEAISRSIVVTVTVDAANTITNNASVTGTELDSNPTNNVAAVSTAVLPVAGLAISSIDEPDPVYIGARLVYTLTVVNGGPSNATGVVLTDTLPAGVTLANASAGCTGATTLTCAIGALNNGASATVSIAVTVTVGADTMITNTASATANEFAFGPATSTATTVVLPAADLAITKTANPITGTAGLPLTYSLVVRNFGPSPATGVVVTDTLPATVQFVSASGGTCNGTNSVVCNLGSLLASDVTTVTLTVLPTTSGTISNTAQVTSGIYDPNLANNTTDPVVTPIKVRLFLPLIRR